MNDMVWIRPLWRLDAGCIAVRVKRFWWSRVTQRRRGVVMSRNDEKFLRYAITYGLLALGLAFYLWLWVSQASAQDLTSDWTLRPLAQQCLDDPSCRVGLRRPRRYRPQHVEPSRNYRSYLPEQGPTRVYGYERRGEPRETRNQLRCERTMEGRGAEANTSEGALRLANRAWQAGVRAELGERFMELKHAGEYKWSCFRSSTNESVAGRALEWAAGAVRVRCQVWARPCRAPVLEGLPEKGEVRKELEEEGALPGPNQPAAQFTR